MKNRKITKKQKKINDAFLDAYKVLEKTAMETENCSVYDLEARLGQDSEEANRLKVSRIIRNFLSHNDNSDGFIAVSQAMIEFLEGETEKESRKRKTAGDTARRFRPAAVSDPLQECAKRLMKLPMLPVVDAENTVIGCITAESICAVCSESSISAKTKAAKAVIKCATVRADMPAENITETAIVADEKGKYKGMAIIHTGN